MLAVSQKVMPSSTACRKMGSPASSSSDQLLNPREVSPKLMQPSAILLTLSPDEPSRTYSMGTILPRAPRRWPDRPLPRGPLGWHSARVGHLAAPGRLVLLHRREQRLRHAVRRERTFPGERPAHR